jgi:Pyridoxamine 5'-phosphate oxidase
VGRTYDAIDEQLASWIAAQPLFFVATAPLAADGHVNVSPKGPMSTFRVLGPRRVAYLDVVGSGAETIAHLRENGRIVMMLCAFSGPPRIVRLHGMGEVLAPDDARFAELLEEARFEDPTVPEAHRAIIAVDVERVSSSCGYGVPLMRYEGERPHLDAWSTKQLRAKGPDALERYQAEHNAESIDGLPAIEPAADPRERPPERPYRSAAGHAIR